MNAGEYFRIDDKLYFMTGDYVLYEKQRLPAMMVNLSMAEDYEIEDLYAAVDEGRWTVDLMNTYAVLVKGDIDGDGTMDYHNDRFGLLMGSYTYTPFLLFGMENTYTKKENDGSFTLNVTSERMLDSISRLGKTLFTDTTTYGEIITNNWTDGASPQYVFEEGRALFYNEVLSIVRTLDTNIRYGVLPLPKYDETQKKYLSTVQNSNSGSIAIPASLSDEDAEFTGLILEALADLSHYTTLPAFIDGVMQTKKAPDEESVRVLQTLFSSENIVYDTFAIFEIGDLNNIVWNNLYSNHGENFVSTIDGKKESVMESYQKVVEAYEKLG
ncbi:MAG: hypothetical protein PUG87_08015 [Eubacteriales bacterium]|nr:hypothetical protein [Eubacteriales bacterium]